LVPLTYTPPIPLLFRTAAYDQLDRSRGIIGNVPRVLKRAKTEKCKKNCVDVEVEIDAGIGPLLVPVPTGYFVESPSLLLDGKPFGVLKLSRAGDPLIDVREPVRGVLKYRVGSAHAALNPKYKKNLLELPPNMTLPRELKRIISIATHRRSTKSTVEQLRKFVEERIAYSISDATRVAYNRFLSADPKGGWLDFVLAYGQGDCDVKNTVLVALLRKARIPARLAVGVIGRRGEITGGYHAWVEYYADASWQHIDATGSSSTVATQDHGDSTDPLRIADHSPPPAMTDSDKTSVSTQKSSPSPTNSMPMVMAIIAATIAAFFAIYGLILFLKGKRKRTLFAPNDQEEQLKIAADMLINVLAHPEAWLRSGGVTKRDLIPVLGDKKAISLDTALTLGRSASLWMSKGESDLAHHSAQRGATVLDASDPVFGPLVKRLPGIVDLDEIACLQPIEREDIPEELRHVEQLIDEVNNVLRQAGLPDQTVMLSEGTHGAPIRDVDLVRLGLPKFSPWPTRFIAVRMESSALLERAELYKKEPHLATFLTMDMLLGESDLLNSHHKRIREMTARFALEGVA
jgi:disulfide bond formation protein DsbB